MSFILDALKKSETDRQQRSSPGIADVPSGSRRASAPKWIPAVVVLLLVNLAAVLYLALRPAPATDVAASGSSATGADQSVEVRTGSAVAIKTAADAAPIVAGLEADAAAAEPAIAEPPTVREAVSEPATAPVETIPAAETTLQYDETPQLADPVRAEDESSFLTFDDLRATGRVDLPDMHVDLHVFSDNPGDRFVFINMNEYRENATLAEGPRVRRITTEGVLLDYRGTTFLLPRD